MIAYLEKRYPTPLLRRGIRLWSGSDDTTSLDLLLELLHEEPGKAELLEELAGRAPELDPDSCDLFVKSLAYIKPAFDKNVLLALLFLIPEKHAIFPLAPLMQNRFSLKNRNTLESQLQDLDSPLSEQGLIAAMDCVACVLMKVGDKNLKSKLQEVHHSLAPIWQPGAESLDVTGIVGPVADSHLGIQRLYNIYQSKSISPPLAQAKAFLQAIWITEEKAC